MVSILLGSGAMSLNGWCPIFEDSRVVFNNQKVCAMPIPEEWRSHTALLQKPKNSQEIGTSMKGQAKIVPVTS
jgi:hypothetical protein